MTQEPEAPEASAIGEPPSTPPPIATDGAGILRMLIGDGGNKTYLYHLNQALTAFEQGGESKESKRGS
ncbi:MAG: hypothetical protein ABI305_07400 [Tepidiformaceae bacterium]